MENRTAKFPIGTQFLYAGKAPRLAIITDILTTTNSKGEFVKLRYVATHTFMGQVVTDHDVVETTIARGVFALTAKVA